MRIYTINSNFIRPNNTTNYTPGQIISNDTTAANCVPLTFSIPSGFLLTGIKITLSKSGYSSANQFSLQLFQFPPVFGAGDGASVSGALPESGYLGNIFLNFNSYTIFSDLSSGVNPVDPNSVLLITDTTAYSSGFKNQVYGVLSTLTALNVPPALGTVSITLLGVD